MAEIAVEAAGDIYIVTVTEPGSSTTHEVTASAADIARLGAGTGPANLIAASFRFLLEREPKESILRNFDLTVIGRYFPEYATRIGDYL
jgi:hypothetical protein